MIAINNFKNEIVHIYIGKKVNLNDYYECTIRCYFSDGSHSIKKL